MLLERLYNVHELLSAVIWCRTGQNVAGDHIPTLQADGVQLHPKTPLFVGVKMVHSLLAEGLKRFWFCFVLMEKGFKVLHL